MIKEGDKIPAFKLMNQHGKEFDISQVTGRKNLVIYFYPKDETIGCTAQACSFRDHYEDFLNYDCEIIGISQDSVEKHTKFADNHRLPFTLLSDEKNEVRKLFGVRKSLGILPGRVTYIVDKKGIVQLVFNSQMQFGKHVNEALTILKQLEKSAQ
ncbi:MAG: redoxin domain-containing protein [Bacteroidetes bacterium]|jgi:peroxiredoxin Q/BCP|nr:redoxin domain-containing protein [Bacteroidota bacterium]